MRRVCLLLLLWLPAVPAVAGTIYKCVDPQGHISYQDTPCPGHAHQTIVHVADATAAQPTATVAAPPPVPVPRATPAPPAAAAARVPPPVLFRCTPATGGDSYLSRTGQPSPYLAPFGVLGGVTVPLTTEYGADQGASVGLSAPELMPRPPPTLIGGAYVWVRDSCRRLPPPAACAALTRLNDANDEAIHQAFRDERAPLLKKRARLHARMAGCRF